jgi:hypothetical protein
MSQYQQVAEQRQNRLALIVANNGPDDVVLSMRQADLVGVSPLGIQLPAGDTFEFTWYRHGELVWGPWFANCTLSTLSVYEWFNECGHDPRRLSPARSPMDACGVGSISGERRQRRDPLLYALVADLLDRAAHREEVCREEKIPPALVVAVDIDF